MYTGTTLATFSIVGKPPVENDILNISANWLQIAFLCNVNVFIEMPVGLTDLFESSEDIIFCISDLLVGIGIWYLFFRKIKEMFVLRIDTSFVFSAVVPKWLLQTFEIIYLVCDGGIIERQTLWNVKR